MELQLRPPRDRFHPLMRARRGFAGLGADLGINSTTMWTPSGGFVQGGGSPAAVYQAPPTIPNPPCTLDTQPGGAAFSSACIDELQKVQQQRFQLANNANFQVDYQNCIGQGIAPADCAARTYGLTPAGGFTSDAGAGPGGSQAIVDRNGNIVAAPPPVYTGAPLYAPSSGGAPVLSFTNLTSGHNSNFKVGDRWQIHISGAAPNQPVSVTGGLNGASALAPQGNTDASGNFSLNGQMTQAQVGAWSEAWSVGSTPVASFTFKVSRRIGFIGRRSVHEDSIYDKRLWHAARWFFGYRWDKYSVGGNRRGASGFSSDEG
jgi:hypothetical protein